MSWIVSPSTAASGSSAALNGTSKPDSYKTQAGWELTKNMTYIGPSSQLYQKSIVLDGFLASDGYNPETFHRGFYGYKINTAASLPTMSIQDNGLGRTTSNIYTYSKQDFLREESASSSKSFWSLDPSFYTGVNSGGQLTKTGLHHVLTGAGPGTITVKCYDDRSHFDLGFGLFKNGVKVDSADTDNRETTMSCSFGKDDVIHIKISYYQMRDYFDTSGCVGFTFGGSDKCEYSFSMQVCPFPSPTIYFNTFIDSDQVWHNKDSGGHQAVLICWNKSGSNKSYEIRPCDYAGNSYTCDDISVLYINGVKSYTWNQDNGSAYNETKSFSIGPYGTAVMVQTYNHDAASSLYDELQNIVNHNAQVTAENKIGNSSINHGQTYYYAFHTSLTEPSTSITLNSTYTAKRIYNQEVLVSQTSVSRTIPKKINRLPSSTGVKTRNSNTYYGYYAAPNGERQYDSFYFVAAQAGTVSGKLRGGTGANYTSWDSYTSYDGEWHIYVNGTLQYTKNADTEEPFSFNVNEGDTISFKRQHLNGTYSDPINERQYVDCSFTGEYAENYYVPVGGTTEWVEYCPYFDGIISTTGPDYTFTCTESGSLSGSFYDNRNVGESDGNDSYLTIFKNGEVVKELDSDNRTDSFNIAISAGDVVVIRPRPISLTNGGSYKSVDKTMGNVDLPTGTLHYEFSGEYTNGISQSYTLSWKQFISCILVEAAMWISREGLTDYAFPLYIDDTTGQSSRLSEIVSMLNNYHIKTDLFCSTTGTLSIPYYTRYLTLKDVWNNGQRITSTNLPYLEELNYILLGGKNLANFAKGSTLKWVKIDTASSSDNSAGINLTQAFANCPSLTYGFANVGNGNATELFLNSPLTKVHLYGIGNASFTRACYGNTSLVEVEGWLNNFGGSFNQTFEGCVNLSGEVKLSVNSYTPCMDTFKNCINLKSAIIEGAISDFSRAFYNCYRLETVNYTNLFSARIIDFTFYNCYKCNLVQSHDTVKAFLSKLGHYKDWVNGVNRTTFFNCPYNGTVEEVYYTYDQQKALVFKPEELMYTTLRATQNSSDAGYHNINHEEQTWSEYVSDYITYAKPHTIKAVSHQLNESSAAAYLEVDGNIIFTFGSRGHCIGVYDCKTMSIKYWDWTDTYAYEIKTTSIDSIWATALSVAGPTDIIFVLTFDATTRSTSSQNYSRSVGGLETYGEWGAARYAHALLGKKGLGMGNGYEHITGSSYAEVTAKFTTDGLVCRTWMDSSTNYIFRPRNDFTYEHPREHYVLEVPSNEYWRWKYLFKNLKSLWDSCAFTYTSTNKANFTLSVLTTGADAEINPNSVVSFNSMIKTYDSEDFIYHIGRIENTSDKDISIKKMFTKVKRIHCVECNFINIDDISYAFYQCDYIEHLIAKMNGCTKAEYTFAECASLKTIDAASNTIVDSQFMCYNCPELEEYDLVKMTALKDATSMFEKCPSLKTEQFKHITKLPECLEITRRMFAYCSITEIEGNWLPPNSSIDWQNYTELDRRKETVEDWVNAISKDDGWSFPSKLYDAYQMFLGNPITKITFLKLNKNANNSWLFQDCTQLTTFKYNFLDVDTYDDSKYTGIFDNCSLSEENRIWLPVSISSDFDLSQTGVSNGNNEPPIEFWVDDYWCEVDNSGFVEYQHIRRPAYEAPYKEHYDKDIIIKYWSHVHIHSAEMRGYNELHDTCVHYDPTSAGHPNQPTFWEGDYSREN